MPPLTRAERDEFLAEPGVLMRVATIDADGAPAVTPIWFAHEDGRIYFTPRRESRGEQFGRSERFFPVPDP